MIQFLRNLFRKLFQWRHDYVPNTERYPQLDLEKIASDLRLAEIGAERGAEGKPESASATFDDIESKIITYFEAERNHSRDRTLRDLSVYDDRLASFAFLSKLDEVKKSAHEATAQLHTLRLQGQGEMLESEQRVQEARRELLDFRKIHRRKYPAVYPESLLLRWGLIAAIVLVEAIVNGFIFAASNSFGVVGGIVYALILSGLNVGIGVIAGRVAFPNLLHRNWFRKLFALIGVFLYLAAIFGLNLMAAHFRDISQSSAALRLESVLLPHVLNSPFGLQQCSSWLLFGLGMLFSLVAAADSHSMDDKYPGYGAVTRRFKGSLAQFNEEYGQLLELAESIRSGTAEAMSAVINSANIEVANYKSLVEGRRRLITSYDDYVRYLEQAGNTLLEVYRRENAGARSTSNPPPASFKTRWTIPAGGLSLPDLPGSLSLEAVDGHIQEAVSELTSLRDALLLDHSNTIQVFAPLRDLVKQAETDGNAA